MTQGSKISETLSRQRIRNRFIEFFEGARRLEDVAEIGAFEEINCWYDIADPDFLDPNFFVSPVFTSDEWQAIRQFGGVVEMCANATEKDVFDPAELEKISDWVAYRDAAGEAYEIFKKRGKFSEDVEEF